MSPCCGWVRLRRRYNCWPTAVCAALKPLPGADSTWLVVKEDTLSRVRARLAEWEVIVSEGVWD
ncbi:hypothetical protein [Candidatus Amarolinea dominans]|uniref:hypothetical protein n=1 Tax=Candidatus Amarolinea dominans TaxID=3140696 RepID=UPI001D3F6EB4|nr:hypothetical protein [Anaerolineae bacterium]